MANETSNNNSGNALQAAVLAPTAVSKRIYSLDVLRGFAVLGILLMNIQSFSMVDPTYFNPSVFGDMTGINYFVWLGSHLLADMKFVTIFSLLFGAGIVLFCERVVSRGGKPIGIHYRRTLWLLFFGLTHAYLLWHGDILVWYSFSAFIAYLFWRFRPGWLIFWSLLLLFIGTAIYLMAQLSMPYWPKEAIAGNTSYWSPPEEVILHRLDTFRGGWVSQLSERIPTSLMFHTFVYVIFGMWRTVGVMLAGMALFKWGILSAKRSNRFYLIAILGGIIIGLPLIGYGAHQHFVHDWSVKYSLYGGSLYNYWGSLFVAMAYLSCIMLICRNEWLKNLQRRLSAVGRLAFSNYILQTLICTAIFYGHGFGLFGSVPRWGQLLITITVWVILVIFSNIWLARFRLGPLEWLWRTLTYRRKQPIR
jgi:uncharacterized protein